MSSAIFLFSLLIFFACMMLLWGFIFIRRNKRKKQGMGGYINEQVYIGNLPYSVTEDDLRHHFARYGSIHSVRIIRNFKTGRSKGYAFVTYFTVDNANAALVAHGKDFCGRSIVVRIAKPRQDDEQNGHHENMDE